MQTEMSGKTYDYFIWDGHILNKSLIAMDTETTVVERPEIADLALTTASDGMLHCIIPNHKLFEFLSLHESARFVFYNVSFDFHVINKHLQEKGHPTGVLWTAADENRLHDYMLLDMLYRLAVNDTFPVMRNLGETSKFYAKLEINKEDPYRMRYGEIIGKPFDEIERGFLDYAIKDTIATWLGFINLYKRAKLLAFEYGISSDVLKSHGLFTESIQVKAALSLSKITNNGIKLNTQLSREMHQEIEGEVWKVVNQLDTEYPGLFKRHKKTDEFELTENNIPKISRKLLGDIFVGVADRLNKIEGIKLVAPKTEKGKISTSMPLWGDYIKLDDFLTKWEIWSDNTKAAQFFSKLDKEVIYPRYKYFVRTGRTSQQDPNCVDGQTEVLTPNGWLAIKDAYGTDTEVMQYCPEKEELTFVKPEWVKTESKIWLNINTNKCSLRVTPDHRCLTYDTRDRKLVILADNIAARLGVINSGKAVGQNIDLTKKDLELLTILCGEFTETETSYTLSKYDSSLYYLRTICFKYPHVKFKLSKSKKKRKVCLEYQKEDLKKFLDITGGKLEFGSWLLKLSTEQLLIIRETGRDRHIKNSWMELINVLCNEQCYTLESVERYTEVLDAPEPAYCVTVPTSFFLVRRADKIYVTGNCQQIKKGRMREIIVPRKGYALMSADYSFIELRTLAYVMEKLFKKSVMADVIRAGKDPHAWTGAMLVNMDYEEFCSLKKTNPDFFDKWRQNAKACFHKDVDCLTNLGWKKISEITQKDLVAQYTKEGKIEFVHPTGTIKLENKNLYKLQSRHFSLRVTDDHNMYCLDWAEKPCTCKPKDFSRKARKTVHAGYMEGAISDEISIRQAVAIQADGSIAYSQYSFGFKKARKIERFKELFNDIDYKEVYDTKYNVTRFTIPNDLGYTKYLNVDKTFNTEEILKLDIKSRLAFIDELQYWDGTHKTERAFNVTSVNLDVINTIQAIAATCGYRTVTNEWIPNLSDNPAYSVSITKTDTARPSKMSYTLIEENATVYCISVPSTLLIVKDEGSVQVCHNCNFGLPGGLSAPSLLNYAKNIYHIKDWTIESAKTFRDKMCNEIYPELGKYLQEDSMRIMCESLGCNMEDAWECFEIQGERSPFITNCIKNVIKGEPFKRDGTRYNDFFVEKIWESLNKLNNNPTLYTALQNKAVGIDLIKKIFWTSTMTDTGRVRGRVSFTQNKNTKFQGLAADGAKLAAYKLIKNESIYNYLVVNFVHDEFVFEVPDLGGYIDKNIADWCLNTMCEEMATLTPGIPIAGEYTVARSWTKKNKNMRVEGNRIYF